MKIGGSFAHLQQINRTVSQVETSVRASNDKTRRHIEAIDAKTTSATKEVVNTAVNVENVATRAKGNFIDTLA